MMQVTSVGSGRARDGRSRQGRGHKPQSLEPPRPAHPGLDRELPGLCVDGAGVHGDPAPHPGV